MQSFDGIRASLKKFSPFYFLVYVCGAVLSKLYYKRESHWFTCEGTSEKHVLNHCLLEYENGHNGMQPWIYYTNVVFPALFVAMILYLVSKKKSKVITIKNCTFHLHQYLILMFLVLFLYHLIIVGAMIYLWTWSTFKLTVSSSYNCSMTKSSYSCTDGNARLYEFINISTSVCSIVNAILCFHSLWIFWARWRNEEKIRSNIQIKQNECQECIYYIDWFDKLLEWNQGRRDNVQGRGDSLYEKYYSTNLIIPTSHNSDLTPNINVHGETTKEYSSYYDHRDTSETAVRKRKINAKESERIDCGLKASSNQESAGDSSEEEKCSSSEEIFTDIPNIVKLCEPYLANNDNSEGKDSSKRQGESHSSSNENSEMEESSKREDIHSSPSSQVESSSYIICQPEDDVCCNEEGEGNSATIGNSKVSSGPTRGANNAWSPSPDSRRQSMNRQDSDTLPFNENRRGLATGESSTVNAYSNRQGERDITYILNKWALLWKIADLLEGSSVNNWEKLAFKFGLNCNDVSKLKQTLDPSRNFFHNLASNKGEIKLADLKKLLEGELYYTNRSIFPPIVRDIESRVVSFTLESTLEELIGNGSHWDYFLEKVADKLLKSNARLPSYEDIAGHYEYHLEEINNFDNSGNEKRPTLKLFELLSCRKVVPTVAILRENLESIHRHDIVRVIDAWQD